MKPVLAICLSILLIVMMTSLHAEDRLGPYGEGWHRRTSETSLPSTLKLVRRIVMDPQQRQNPNQAATRGSRWGSTRSRYIVSRDGEIAILIPGTNATDLGIYSSTGILLRRFPTLLTKSTRGEYNPTGSEGRDLRPGQFSSYWASNGVLYFQSAGDMSDRGAYDDVTGVDMPLLSENTNNAHAHYGMFDGSSAVWSPTYIPASGHGAGYMYLKYSVNGISRALGDVANDFNHPTPLMDEDELFVSSPAVIPAAAMSGSVYEYGFGTSVKQLILDPVTGTYSKGWVWENPDEVLTINYDGNTQSRPICMDETRIYLVTHPTYVGYTYPHLDVSKPSTLRVLDRVTGVQISEISLGNIVSGTQLAYQISLLPGGKVVVLSVGTSASSDSHLVCADIASNSVAWRYDYPVNGVTPDDQWHAESTRLYSTPDQICVCYAKTNTTKKTVTVTVDRFAFTGGTPVRTNFASTVPGVDTKAFVDDFVVLNGRAYALVTYREFVAGGAFTGGGQLFIIMGNP